MKLLSATFCLLLTIQHMFTCSAHTNIVYERCLETSVELVNKGILAVHVWDYSLILMYLLLSIYLPCSDSPKEPYNIALTPGVTGISVSWEHDRSCFEGHAFVFIVNWQKACTCDLSELSTAVIGTTFNIQDLEPDTIYSICVSAVSSSDDQVKSERNCIRSKTLKRVCKCYSNLPHTVHLCVTGRNTLGQTFMFTIQ